MPGDDAAVELQNLDLQYSQLTAESSKARACRFREPAVVCISDDFQQLLDTPAPKGATIPNSARYARIELMTAVCWRMKRWRAR